jgi:NADH:ubiquinone oxidoreductase subunit F (NADH-binding)
VSTVSTVSTIAIELAPSQRLPRLLAGLSYHRVAGLAAHEQQYGPLPDLPRPARLIDMVSAAGLTGRGGGAFPAGRKLRTAAGQRGRKVLIANGCEGEPASSKDRLLLTRLPHLVLDGITLAAEAIGAREAHLCVHRQETALIRHLESAIAERRAGRLDRVRILITGTPGRYAASEQSALIDRVSGGPGKPVYRRREADRPPALVHNVETLAQIALIARYGEGWFRGAGLPTAPGSTLVTVGGAVARPGVYEIELGTPAGQVIMLAGGPAEPPRALLTGGYFGSWLPAAVAWPVPMTHASLKAAGGAMGAGIVIALPASSCPLAETARVVRYLAEESAGQCGPCMFGLPALAEAVADLAFHGGRSEAADRVAALAALVERRGACRHPDGAAQLVRSMLGAFPEDVRWHDSRGPCAGIRRGPILPVPGDDERDWGWA